MFSKSASRSMSSSEVSRTIAGMCFRPAFEDARQRRSPMISSKPSGVSRTTMGCSRPNSRMEWTSSASSSSSKTWRGCFGLGMICPTGISW